MDSIPYALFLLLNFKKMQKSNVTSFLQWHLKKLARKLVRKKVKKFAFDHCKTCSERFVIWRDNFSFIFQRKEDKEMSEKRCYTVQELQEILGVSRPTIYNLLKKKEFRWIQLDGGKYRISKKSFDDWLDNLEQ